MRDLLAERNRAAELSRGRRLPPAGGSAPPALSRDLPTLIETSVEQQMGKLENKLVEGFREMGERVVKESTALLTSQLEGRIQQLEKVSALQTETINHLRDSSKVSEQKVAGVVTNIEKALSSAVPGFKLDAPTHLPPQIGAPQPESPARPATALVRTESRAVEDGRAPGVYCPKCTSTNVRRSARSGMWEEFLRLFFVAPFRCRACRHKFYRF